MRWVRFAFLVCAASVLQAGFLSNQNLKLDLLLINVVFFAIYYSCSEAIVTSFALGFAADISGFGHAMGPQMISFGLAGTALAFLHRIIAIRKKPYQAIAIFISVILTGILTGLLNHFKGDPYPDAVYYKSVLFTALVSAIVGPFLFIPIAWWMQTGTNRYRKR
jgi:rod shape-determining protein MreD